MQDDRHIKLKFSVLEDDEESGFSGRPDAYPRAWATPEMVSWWERAMSALEKTDPLTKPRLNYDLVRLSTPSEVTIEVMLCSRKSFDTLSGTPGALGCHLASPLESFPESELRNLPEGYRVLVVSDREEFLAEMEEMADEHVVPGHCDLIFLSSWLNTTFHEIAHAVLFAENAAFTLPAVIEANYEQGLSGYCTFDCSTGYGIRPLVIDGEDIWSDDMESALEHMEAYVEQLGTRMRDEVLVGDLHPMSFLEAAGVADEFNRIMCGEDIAQSAGDLSEGP